MTAIAGVVHKGKAYIGGDSAGVSGWTRTVRADSKVFITGPFVMGFTSSFRMGQLLRYAFLPPEHHADVPVERFMVTTFIDEVRRCLREGGFASRVNEAESGGTFLVGYRGRLFEIGDDYQVGEPSDGFAAVGSGEAQVLGALYVTQGRAPQARIMSALEAASHFNIGVCGPFVVVREP